MSGFLEQVTRVVRVSGFLEQVTRVVRDVRRWCNERRINPLTAIVDCPHIADHGRAAATIKVLGVDVNLCQACRMALVTAYGEPASVTPTRETHVRLVTACGAKRVLAWPATIVPDVISVPAMNRSQLEVTWTPKPLEVQDTTYVRRNFRWNGRVGADGLREYDEVLERTR